MDRVLFPLLPPPQWDHLTLPSTAAHSCCSVTKCVRLFVITWTAARQDPLFFTISWSLLKFMSIEWVMPSSHLILCLLCMNTYALIHTHTLCAYFSVILREKTLLQDLTSLAIQNKNHCIHH